jgi:pectate lyase
MPLPSSLSFTPFAALFLGLAFFAAAQEPPAVAPKFPQTGFSTMTAYGQTGTTGGGDLTPITVRTAKEFQTACERLDIKDKLLREQTPRVILVGEDLDLGELKNVTGNSTGKAVGIVRVQPRTTIYSTSGAVIRRGTLEVHGTSDIIIANLKFRDLWELDPTNNYDALGWDYIRITDKGENRAHHVWVDHCDFGKVYDGALDIVHGSDCVTVSWCKFSGDERGPQKKVTLIGHSSGAGGATADRGYLNVTLHHNWYQNIEDRAPRARFGNIHTYNNLVDGAHYATISVMGAVTLVEGNVYNDVRCATSFSHAKDAVAKEKGGTICIVDSLNENPRPALDTTKSNELLEQDNNFKSNVGRDHLVFNKPAGFDWANLSALPYPYDADPASDTATLVKHWAGAGTVAYQAARFALAAQPRE